MIETPWWEWIRANDSTLAKQYGVSRAEAQNLRLTNTGHCTPLSPRWLLTVGMWGGARTVAEIDTAYGTPPLSASNARLREEHTRCTNQRRQFMHYWDLKTRPTLKYFADSVQRGFSLLTPVLTALDILRFVRTAGVEMDVASIAKSYGILPIECFIYFHNALIIEEDLYERARLRRAWDALNEYTPKILFDYVIHQLPLYWNLPYAVAVDIRHELGLGPPPRALYLEPLEVLDVSPSSAES